MTIVELFHLEEYGAVARIERGSRVRRYIRVTPASRARLGMYVFRCLSNFTVVPFVTGCVGWTAERHI